MYSVLLIKILKLGSGHKNIRYVSDNTDYSFDRKYVFNDVSVDYTMDEYYSNMVLREDGSYYPKRPLPVGVTSFIKTAESYCYVDKIMMISDLLTSGVQISMFTRPRRFGKTTNMDMLRVFFEISDEDTSVYFEDKKIWQCDEWVRLEQGKYPVIFISFKDVKYADWKDAFEGIKSVIIDEFRRHDYLLQSEMLADYEKEKFTKVMEWFDGYYIGNYEIFNPWSVINYVDNDFKPRPYWSQTSSNTLLGDIMVNASGNITEQLEKLMVGDCVYTTIDITVICPEIDASVSRILSFLMMEGYITFEEKELDEEGYDFCKVRIPNKEVMTAFRREIVNRYCNNVSGVMAEKVQQALKFKDADMLQQALELFLMCSVSYYDTANESFYHGLVLGMVGMFSVHYEVSSNKEAGDGRYDIMLRPRDKSRPAYILELKTLDKIDDKLNVNGALEELASEAVKQIKDKKYYKGLCSGDYTDIVLVGMAFHKKKCCIKVEK